MKRVTILILATLLLCGCQKTEPETEPDTELTTPDTTASEAETTTEAIPPDETAETVRQPYDPEAAGEIPPWETAMREEEFIHTWNPAPTLKQQSFQILRFGEKYTDDQGNEAIREDDWIVETRSCYVRMKQPSHWYWDGVSGTEREGDIGRDSLRFAYEKVLYRRTEIPDSWVECATDTGNLYYRWEVEADGITEYHFAYPTRVALVDYWFETIFYGHPDNITEPSPEEYYDAYVQPMAESVQLETYGGGIPLEMPEPVFTEYTYTATCPNPDCPMTCQVTLSLPDTWEQDEYGGFYDTLRQENTCLKSVRFVPQTSISDKRERTYDYKAIGEMHTTKTGYTYHTNVHTPVPMNPYTAATNDTHLFPLDEEDNHVLAIRFFTYPAESDAPDPDDYYDTHIRPIIDSVKLEIQQ